MPSIKIPKPSKVLELEQITLEPLEKIMNYSLHGRLVLEGLLNSQKGIQVFKENLEEDMYNHVVLSYIFEIGDIWLNLERRKRFDQLVMKILMYPDFDLIIKMKPKSVFRRHKNLWSIMENWGKKTDSKDGEEWKLETCFQEWNKLIYLQKNEENYWESHNKYGNFVARILIYYMNYLQHPLSLYHVLMLNDVSLDLRTDMSRYVRRLVYDREAIETIKPEYKDLTEKYDKLKETSKKVLRKNYPLQYLIIDDDGKCVLKEWIVPKFTRRKKFFKNLTKKNNSQLVDRQEVDETSTDTPNQNNDQTETREYDGDGREESTVEDRPEEREETRRGEDRPEEREEIRSEDTRDDTERPVEESGVDKPKSED